MSRNLVELIRRHHSVDAPTALEVLKEAMDDHGELTDADRKRAAEVSGLPEAAVYGVSTFYDDLLAPRGTRHVRVCTGTACFAAAGETTVERVGEGLGIAPGERSADGSVSLAETVCLGFCHSSPAIRVGDTVDAGPGVAERAIAGESRAADEPEWVSLLPEPVLLRAGDWSGLRRALTELGPQGLLTEVEGAEVRGRGGAGFPAGAKWAFAAKAEGAEKFIVANGDEGDPGSYIDKYLMERNPELLLEGMALAGYAVGAAHGFVFCRSEYPMSKPALERAAASARERGLLGEGILGTDFDFDVTIIEGAGSYVVGEETALLACVQGLRGTVSARPPFPAERGVYGMPTVVNNVETLCNVPFVATAGAAAYRALSPDTETTGSKLVCFNERFARPSVYEVPFGMTVRELCEDVAGGLARRRARSRRSRSAARSAASCPPPCSTRASTSSRSPRSAAWSATAASSPSTRRTDMRDVARHLLRFGADESCGKCFPCRIGLRRAYEEFAADAPVQRARLEDLLEALELGSLCAHGGGIPAPLRSLLTHFPDELGLA